MPACGHTTTSNAVNCRVGAHIIRCYLLCSAAIWHSLTPSPHAVWGWLNVHITDLSCGWSRRGVGVWLVGFKSHSTHYRSFRGRFLQAIWPNQQSKHWRKPVGRQDQAWIPPVRTDPPRGENGQWYCLRGKGIWPCRLYNYSLTKNVTILCRYLGVHGLCMCTSICIKIQYTEPDHVLINQSINWKNPT